MLETLIALIIYKGSHGKRSRACLDILGQLVWRQGICCLAGGRGLRVQGILGGKKGCQVSRNTGSGEYLLKVGMCSYKHR